MNPSSSTEPFYFGAAGERLFGCYDPPRGPGRRGAGIVLCYPAGHEYIAAHRAFRQLAMRLSQNGFPVLRFDYYGSGDSAGEHERASLSRWQQDVGNAVTELRERAGCSRFVLLGLRLGASLSILVAERRDDVVGLVLWDPVLEGRRYLEDIRAQHRELTGGSRGSTEEDASEILGFSFSRNFCLEIESLDLSSRSKAPADRVLILETGRPSGSESLARAYRERTEEVEYSYLEAPGLRLERVDRVMVPANVIASIVAWIARGQ